MTTQTRSTKEIVTPSGNKVVVYDYITGGEMRKITALYMRDITAGDFNGVGEKKAMSKVPVLAVFEAQELALKMLIVSVDGGSKEEAYDSAMALREEDLAVLMTEIDQYTSGTTEKKNESSPTTSQDA